MVYWETRIDYVSVVFREMRFDPYCIRPHRVPKCAADYPLVICHETESFDDFIKTLGFSEIYNSHMYRRVGVQCSEVSR